MEARHGQPGQRLGSRRALVRVLIIALAVTTALAGCGEDERVSVPDLVGMEEAEAENAVADAGLTLGEIEYVPADAASVEAGQVAAQAPLAGTQVDSETEVALVVAQSSEKAGEEGTAGKSSGGTGSGSGSGTKAEPTTETKAQADPEPPHEELGDSGWRVVIDDSGTGAYLSPVFSTTSTKLFLSIEVSSTSGGELTFDLLETGDATRSVLRYVVPATSTSTEHAFDAVSRPVRNDYRIWIWMPDDVKSPKDIEWRFVLREEIGAGSTL